MTSLFSKGALGTRNKRVIEAIHKFYKGDILVFPYSLKELKAAEKWYRNQAHDDLDEILLHRFRMVEQLIRKKDN